MSAQTVHASRHVDQQNANLAYFLKYARKRPIPLAGTIPTGSTGGTPASNVAFNDVIPVVPAWASAIIIEATLPLTVTVPAGGSASVSPYGAYAALNMMLTLAGSPPWDQISLVPWLLDEITSSRFFDPGMTGPNVETAQQDAGPFAYANGGYVPGSTINPGTVAGTVTLRAKVRLQRRPHLLFGCVPLGDPENRPQIKMQLGALVGPNPEANMFTTQTGAATTASLTAPATVNVIFEGLSLDVLPPGLSSIPTPIVGLGLAVNYSTQNIVAAGQLVKNPRNAAMLYEKVFHQLFNAAAGQRADYFGKWLTGEQQSARYEFDASQGTFNDYYKRILDRYHRYLPRGLYVDDMVGGDNPDNPRADPYEAQMTPDTGYAAEFGLPATPAWNNALRIPAGTALTNAYLANYEFGLVNVPY
jgi:hypothetical protein